MTIQKRQQMGWIDQAIYSEGLGARLMVQGDVLTQARRAELKGKLRRGELEELSFDAVVFRDGPNANHTRFRADELADFANSFAGVPFLRNHATGDIGARDGTVVRSMLVGSEFQQTVRLTTERGMRDFLEGVIDRFSIGWYFEGVECSVCGEDWFECSHWPGRRYPTLTLPSLANHYPQVKRWWERGKACGKVGQA